MVQRRLDAVIPLAKICAFIVCASLPAFAIAQLFGARVGFLSFDVIAAAAIVSYSQVTALRRWLHLSQFLLCCVMLVDLISFLPNGVSIVDAVTTGLGSAAHSDVASEAVLLFGVLMAALAYWIARPRHIRIGARQTFLLLAVTAGLYVAIVANGMAPPFRSAAWGIVKTAWLEPSALLIKYSLKTQKPHEPDQPQVKLMAGRPTLFVMVESWGVPTGARKATLEAEVRELSSATPSCHRESKYEVIDSANFTIQTEVLRLCGVRMQSFRVDLSDVSCAPAAWGLGVRNAYHNNSLGFYSRRLLYAQTGFEKTYGRQEMRLASGEGIPFNGAADADVSQFIAEMASRYSGLHYWMTLDMHGPYGPSRGVAGSPTEVYWSLRRQTMGAILRLIEQLPDYSVVITGDHPPKFFSPDDAGFLRNKVPYVELGACT